MKILKNKKGAGSAWIATAAIAMVVLVAMFGFIAFQSGTFAGKGSATAATAVKESAQAANFGKASTVRFRALDQSQSTSAVDQVATTLYLIDSETGKRVGGASTTLSATALTSISTTVGKKLKAYAFDATYYGEVQDVDVVQEVQPVDLNVWAMTSGGLKIDVWDNSAELTDNQTNITLGAGQTDSLDYIKITVNVADAVFNLKGIALDLPSASNVTNFVINGMQKANVPQRLASASSAEYYYELPQAKLLKSWDVFQTGTVAFTAHSSNNPNVEAFTLRILDEAYYSGADANKIGIGVEDDAPSPAGVGAADVTVAGNVL